MMLWVLMLFLVLVVLLALALPLLRRTGPVLDRNAFNQAVYRDQLDELEREIARGLLPPADAAATRLEIQRRMLASGAPSQSPAARRTVPSPVTACAVAAFVAVGGSGVYAILGAPSLADAPFVSAAAAGESPHGGGAAAGSAGGEHGDLAQAAARLAEKLKANPSNADGWLLYARTSGSLRQWGQAVDAYRHAIAVGAAGPEVQAGLGETLTLQAGGMVTPAAHDAFVAALKDDPKNDVALYYMALAAGQAGEPQKAIDLLQTLAATIPEDSPMRPEIAKRVAEAAKAAGLPLPELVKGTPAAPADPDADAMDAAAAMQPDQQTAMITAMVAKLADRLQAEPGDVDGWMRLGKAYVVMKERGKASDAYEKAAALAPKDVAIRLRGAEGLMAGLKADDALPPAAVALLRQAEALSPDEPEVLWYLGVVAARDAHPAQARRYWTRLLPQLPPGGEDARMVKAAMDGLVGG